MSRKSSPAQAISLSFSAPGSTVASILPPTSWIAIRRPDAPVTRNAARLPEGDRLRFEAAADLP